MAGIPVNPHGRFLLRSSMRAWHNYHDFNSAFSSAALRRM